MISRREVLVTGAGLTAGGVLRSANPMNVHLGCQTNAWAIDPRDFSNVLAIVKKVKGYGYEGFETGRRYPPDRLGRLGQAWRRRGETRAGRSLPRVRNQGMNRRNT
jgi:hypothetical protein